MLIQIDRHSFIDRIEIAFMIHPKFNDGVLRLCRRFDCIIKIIEYLILPAGFDRKDLLRLNDPIAFRLSFAKLITRGSHQFFDICFLAELRSGSLETDAASAHKFVLFKLQIVGIAINFQLRAVIQRDRAVISSAICINIPFESCIWRSDLDILIVAGVKFDRTELVDIHAALHGKIGINSQVDFSLFLLGNECARDRERVAPVLFPDRQCFHRAGRILYRQISIDLMPVRNDRRVLLDRDLLPFDIIDQLDRSCICVDRFLQRGIISLSAFDRI